MNLEAKVAIVLGVSEQGSIGYAIAQQLIQNGAKVIVASRNEQKVSKVAASLGAQSCLCDICDEKQLALLAQFALNKYGRLDIAINCAGDAVVGDIAQAQEADVRKAVDVLFVGPLFFLKQMAAAIGENGSIITLSSITAMRPVSSHAAYMGAKAGTDNLIRTAAIEFGSKNIKVNSVSPGFTDDTPMSREFLQLKGMREVFEKEIPLGRLNTAQDVAHAVVWLCDEKTYITGQNIQVNGGNSLTRMPNQAEMTEVMQANS